MRHVTIDRRCNVSKLICLKHDMVDHMLRASFKTSLKLLIHNDPAMLKIKPLFFS